MDIIADVELGMFNIFHRVAQVPDLCNFAKWYLLKEEVNRLAIKHTSAKYFRTTWEQQELLQTLNTLYELKCANAGVHIDEFMSSKYFYNFTIP